MRGQPSQPANPVSKKKERKGRYWLILLVEMHLNCFQELAVYQLLSRHCLLSSFPYVPCSSPLVHRDPFFQHSQLLSNQELSCHLWLMFTLLHQLLHCRIHGQKVLESLVLPLYHLEEKCFQENIQKLELGNDSVAERALALQVRGPEFKSPAHT